jgi:membrane protein
VHREPAASGWQTVSAPPAAGRAGLAAKAKQRWATLRQQNAWLDHALRAYKRFQTNHGNHFAAAITFFSFLALFPLLLLGVSVIGFVLHSDPKLQQDVIDDITKQAPGGFGETLKSSLTTAINARTSIGIVGLVGLLLTGSGWIGNLRSAIEGVWGQPPIKRSFVKAKLANLLVLGGLGLAILISLGLTAVGTALTGRIISALGLSHLPGANAVVTVLGLAIAVLGDMLILAWLLVRLPRVEAARGEVVRGALLAAVGFEALKIIGTYTIAATSRSPTAGPFASIVAVLIWIQLVSRFLLFCAAWLAESVTMSAEAMSTASVPLSKDGDELQADQVRGVFSPLGVAGTLLGAGAAAGGGAVLWATHRLRGRRRLAPPEPSQGNHRGGKQQRARDHVSQH